MDKETAQGSIKELNSELIKLTPTAIISLFEIDFTDIAIDLGVNLFSTGTVFRFHNTKSLLSTTITWRGLRYVGAPIQAEGFELSYSGSPPTPTISITSSEEGIPAIAQIKDSIRSIGDLIGAKVTRYRTMAKFLLEKDETVEFPPDIYFVSRKSKENKFILEYELASILDIDDIVLPRRIVSIKRCPFRYRGIGCFYDCKKNLKNDADFYASEECSPNDWKEDTQLVKPVATINDVLITDVISDVTLKPRDAYDLNAQYSRGDYFYINKDNVNYYYVVLKSALGVPPPNDEYYIPDQCSKSVFGCSLRWGNSESIPFGGFPSVKSRYE
jgi:lambda family phage minor tail protein L